MNKKDKKNIDTKITVRFHREEDIEILKIFRNKCKKEKIVFNSKLIRYIIEGISNEINKTALNNFKNELFYAFQKSSFASIKTLVNKINEMKYLIDQETSILNLKNDVLLNVMFNRAENNTESLDNLTQNHLQESGYFSKIRVLRQKNLEKIVKKQAEKLEKEKETNINYVQNYMESDLRDILVQGEEGEYEEE